MPERTPDWRFARTPKWISAHVLFLLLVVTFVNLGLWQLRRLDQRQADNALIEARSDLPAEPVGDLLDPGDDPSEVRFRSVEATGTYRSTANVAVRANQDGRSGARVFAVLDLPDGASVAVLRGFVGAEADGSIDPPPPPQGEVEIEGVAVPTANLESVFRQGLDRLPDDDGRLPVVIQAAEPDGDGVRVVPPPELGNGPHLSYAIQWFLFTAVGLIGYPLLLRRRSLEPDDVDDAAGTP